MFRQKSCRVSVACVCTTYLDKATRSTLSLVKCLSVFSNNTTILLLAVTPACFLLSSYSTSICSVILDAKVSVGSSGVVTGCEDDAANGFVLPDYTGDGWCGHDPVVANDQTTYLKKGVSHRCVSVCAF